MREPPDRFASVAMGMEAGFGHACDSRFDGGADQHESGEDHEADRKARQRQQEPVHHVLSAGQRGRQVDVHVAIIGRLSASDKYGAR